MMVIMNRKKGRVNLFTKIYKKNGAIILKKLEKMALLKKIYNNAKGY
jgi:hypothetical protein